MDNEFAQQLPDERCAAGVFPLPLSPFERMMFVEGRPDSPMTQVLALTFSGSVDREAMNAAVRAAVLRHPLLRARIGEPRSRRPRWVLHDEFPRLHWESNDAPEAAPGGHIDLASGPGLRLRAWHKREELCICAELHHACADGLGLFLFVEDLLGVYAALAGHDEPAPALRALQPGDLAHRDNLANGNAGPPLGLGGTLARLREALKFVTERPAPLTGASSPYRQAQGVQPRLLRHRLSAELTARLRGVAARGRATLNDLLLRELFLTLDRRSNSRGGIRDERWRILVPCNLRERRHKATPAANFIGYGFLTRIAGQWGNPDDLLESIRTQTAVIRTSGVCRHFLDALSLADRVPWVFPVVSSWRHCFATSLFSNIGDPTRRFTVPLPRRDGLLVAGGLTLVDVGAWTPLRPLTQAGFVASTCGNRLSIALTADSQALTDQDARELLDDFITGLEHCAAAAVSH